MLAAILAAATVSAAPVVAAPPVMPPADAPTTRERAEAERLCRYFEVPKSGFAACVASMLRNNPERRAYGPAYAWAHTTIEPGDWRVLESDPDRVLLGKPGGGAPWAPRAWVRTESREGADGAMSRLTLYEYDCLGERLRALQGSAYPDNNLRGEAMTVTADMPKWEYAPPGSSQDTLMRDLCRPLRAANAAEPAP